MIAILDHTDKAPSFLRGLTGGVTARRICVLRAPCVHITLAAAQNTGVMDRQLKSALRALRRAGISEVCFAHDFPYSEHFIARGFVHAGSAELFDAMSDKVAEYIARPGSAAYLYAPRPHDMAIRTLAELCRKCALVMADIPGGEEAYTALRRSLGVSIVERPPEHMLAEAEIAFIFGVPRFSIALPDSCVVYASEPDALRAVSAARYVSELDVTLPEERERELPDGFPRAPLITEALRGLTLSRTAPVLREVVVSAV